jgi:hypothetical protein
MILKVVIKAKINVPKATMALARLVFLMSIIKNTTAIQKKTKAIAYCLQYFLVLKGDQKLAMFFIISLLGKNFLPPRKKRVS